MDDMDHMLKALLGQNAVRSGSWLYVQDAGERRVSFVGGASVPEGPHPFRFGSERTHQFVTGEVLVRPQLVLATDSLRGMGLSGILSIGHRTDVMLADGEVILGDPTRP